MDAVWKEANKGQSAVEVIKSFHELKEEYKQVVKEVEALKAAQKKAMEDMMQEMKNACQLAEEMKSNQEQQ